MSFYWEMWLNVPPDFHFPLSFQVLICQISYVFTSRQPRTQQRYASHVSKSAGCFERVFTLILEIRSMINTIVRYAHSYDLIYDTF